MIQDAKESLIDEYCALNNFIYDVGLEVIVSINSFMKSTICSSHVKEMNIPR